ncbi:BatA domain-containing protein [Cerasicoccus arenae]|uniref:Aerotolerance regulator N-terminal domain-containing protein n=1 Tax=Cerasicoccus arenae TaxID=424488 RepID=A0A8J3DDD5_9BACT|nr:BatA domain-containing protein [Cerasicoccus arenae]MBK1859578.1 BatA and WFA domain-containing protein [Cerasicoccus arenae]GHB92843.1 hypothetical protein GCM10007047_05170 [Cerasicoccus arenae]
MNIFLANQWGLLGLLAIPAIIAIHCFQRQARPLLISTLFLMPKPQSESRSGRRWEFWRNSWAFWMQILAALLLTILLAQPRIIKDDSTAQVAIVLDASASMSAFRDSATQTVNHILGDTSRLASNTTWLVRDSLATSQRLYHGEDANLLRQSLEAWQPTHGTHDAASALRAAQTAVGREGRVIFITDEANPALESLAEVVTVGEPLANVGFTGVRTDQRDGQPIWQAIIRNYSDTPQQRKWWIEGTSGTQTEPQNLSIPANGVRRVGGAFPEEESAISLRLEGDAFTFDDHAPIVHPRPRPVAYIIRGEQSFAEWIRKAVARIPGIQYGAVDGQTDLGVHSLTSPERLTTLPQPYAIAFAKQGADVGSLSAPQSFVEAHPLVEGLTFNGLVIQREDELPLPPSDNAVVLVWSANEPLIYLESTAQGRVLVFRFDPAQSNLDRLPAYVILLNRFIATARQQRRSPWRENFETHQALPLPSNPIQPYTIQHNQTEPLPLKTWNAPTKPTLFTVIHGGDDLLQGAARFADIREADLRQARTAYDLTTGNNKVIRQNLEDDLLTPLWALLLIGTMLANYHFTGRNT